MALLTKEDIENIEKNIKTLEKKVKDDESTIAENLKDIESLDKQRDKLKADIKAINNDLSKVTDEKKVAEQEEKQAQEAAAKAAKELTDAEDAVVALEDNLDTTSDSVAKAEADFSTAEDEYMSFVKEEDDLKAKETEIAEKLAKETPGSEKHTEISGELNNLRTKLAGVVSQKDTALADKNSFKSALDSKISEIETLKDKYEAAKDAKADKTEKMDEAKENLNDIKNELANKVDAFTHLTNVYEATSTEKETADAEFLQRNNDLDKVKVKVLETNDQIEYLRSGETIKAYEAQVEERLEFAREIAPTEGKAKNILFGKVDEEEAKEAESDNKIVRDAILEGLGVGDEGYSDNKINNIIGNIKDKALKANEAYEMAEMALFSLDAILDKIKAEASKGNLSMKINGADLTATKALAIIDLGYRVTYETISKAKGRSALEFTISWGFVGQAS